MRHLFRFGLAAVVVLVLAAGGLTLAKSQQPAVTAQAVQVDDPLAQIQARRDAQEARIAEARRVGRLHGMGYLALLGEQQKILVAIKRAEANGLTPEARTRLTEALDRADVNITKQISLR